MVGTTPLIHHLYLADLGIRHGAEPGKLRPVLVLQTDLLNRLPHDTTIVIPCTTNVKPPNMVRVLLPKGAAGNFKACDLMIDKIRVIDTRLIRLHLGKTPQIFISEIEEKLAGILNLKLR